MKPEFESRRLFGIARAKGKMYEFGVSEGQHLKIDSGVQPESVLLLAIGTLGDTAARIADDPESLDEDREDIEFAASYFDALISSQLEEEFAGDATLLASAAYYLAGRPGSSRVMADRFALYDPESPTESVLSWILGGCQDSFSEVNGANQEAVQEVVAATRAHFDAGSDHLLAITAAMRLRGLAYNGTSSRDLLLADIVLAVLTMKFRVSSWVALPDFSGLDRHVWRSAVAKPSFPKELWPAQMEIGKHGLFAGESGVVQMPTSAGKTRSLEMILRSGFLSGRVRLVVVVAPFRALSHEIATSMREAFFGEQNVNINELSDAIQYDCDVEIDLAMNSREELSGDCNVLVLTPEKLQYVVRQKPDLMGQIDLLIYDEAHQFDSGARGVTYELLVTEIRAALGENAQVVAISAVIHNSDELCDWLLGSKGNVIDGSGLSPTARAVAFASWLERRGQLQFFESSVSSGSDYFVPRVLEQHRLDLIGRERAERLFPDRGEGYVATDVALYIGLRVVSKGSVAIFAGTKATANKIARRAVKVFDRGLDMSRPASLSDRAELDRLNSLVEFHFGADSWQYRAARLGIFVHHGNTPNGLRLAIEHAMQNDLIKFVVCTSTLAQGVNLPIRYLVITGTQQGQDSISVRDFQNLLGRAGRAGIHTEGLVIFADPRTFDRRRAERWRFAQSVRLLDPRNSEPTGSSILSVVDALEVSDVLISSAPEDIVSFMFGDDPAVEQQKLDSPELSGKLQKRLNMLKAVESYLMANRRAVTFEEFRKEAVVLCKDTFAYAQASDNQKNALVSLFERIAEAIEETVSSAEKQAEFGRTLLNAETAEIVFSWVDEHRIEVTSAATSEQLLDVLWPLLSVTFQSTLVQKMTPMNAPYDLTSAWIRGASYWQIFRLANEGEFSKPYGKEKRRPLTEDDILGFLSSTISFDTALIVAAVCQFLGEEAAGEDSPLGRFLKAIKYGLSTELGIAAYEIGFADREIASIIASDLKSAGYMGDDVREALLNFPELPKSVVEAAPDYFALVMRSLT